MTGLRGRRLLYPTDREWMLRSDLLRRAHQNDQRGGLRGRAQAAAGLHLPASLRGDTAACVTAQPGKVLQPYWSCPSAVCSEFMLSKVPVPVPSLSALSSILPIHPSITASTRSLNKVIWKLAVHPISRAASNTGDTGCNWHLWQLQEDSYCNPLLTPLSIC